MPKMQNKPDRERHLVKKPRQNSVAVHTLPQIQRVDDTDGRVAAPTRDANSVDSTARIKHTAKPIAHELLRLHYDKQVGSERHSNHQNVTFPPQQIPNHGRIRQREL